MILDARVNVWWLLWMRHDTDIQRAPAGHKNWGDKGGGGTGWQETQLWQRAGHRIRIQQRQSPWTTTRKQHNWHCAPQVPRQCPGPSSLACVCDHDWFGNIYSENMINCLLSGLHHHSYPSLELILNPIISMDDWLPELRATSWLNLKILTIFQRENECKEAKVPNGPMELFWIRDLIKFKHVVHFSLD